MALQPWKSKNQEPYKKKINTIIHPINNFVLTLNMIFIQQIIS